MSEQLKNIWVAYLVLLNRVHLALRTQLGDVAWLSQQCDEALCLLEAAEQVRLFSQIWEMPTTLVMPASGPFPPCWIQHTPTKYCSYSQLIGPSLPRISWPTRWARACCSYLEEWWATRLSLCRDRSHLFEGHIGTPWALRSQANFQLWCVDSVTEGTWIQYCNSRNSCFCSTDAAWWQN